MPMVHLYGFVGNENSDREILQDLLIFWFRSTRLHQVFFKCFQLGTTKQGCTEQGRTHLIIISRNPVRFVAISWWWKSKLDCILLMHGKIIGNHCWLQILPNNSHGLQFWPLLESLHFEQLRLNFNIPRHARYQARQRHSWHERFHGWGGRVLRCSDFWGVEFPSIFGMTSVPLVYHSKMNERSVYFPKVPTSSSP